MENEVLVKVEGLSKKFCKDLKTSLWYGVKDIFGNIGSNKKENVLRPKEFWAVRDVNFELRRGECLGLIGHNGAGKSTLLKMLNGLINPDEGKITMKGRVGALIELGAGFNPILTGRENIYNNGAVLGFTKREIDSKVEEIIDFSEIREFIDMPVQNYSSGMKVRLGFAVAAQMEPDILIIDEVLAVGDLAFKVKCYNTIAAILPRTAILFVSHSMPQISKLCTSSLLLNRGVVKEHSNNISAVINSYFCDSRIDKKENIICFGETKLIEKELIYNQKVLKESQVRVSRGSTFAIRMRLNVDKSVKNFFIRMVVYDAEFKGLVELNSLEDDFVITNTNDINDIQVNIENIFNSGEYNITLIVLELLKDNRIGKRLLVYEGFASINSVSLDSLHESYIPVTLNTNWIANN